MEISTLDFYFSAKLVRTLILCLFLKVLYENIGIFLISYAENLIYKDLPIHNSYCLIEINFDVNNRLLLLSIR